jgi:large subunit ribosomal protein L5
MDYVPRLKNKYKSEIVENLKKNYKTVMQVPKLVKISLNQGVGNAVNDKKLIEAAQQEMTLITGQKAVLTKSRKDISNFKLRKGMPVGVMVTLRGDRMYEFLDRLVTSALPRVRDFQGISNKGFDGRGNYTLGIKEQIAFPEISIDKVLKVTGMDITFVTNTDSDE